MASPGDGEAKLSWEIPNNSVEGITGYALRYATDGEFSRWVAISNDANTREHTVEGLANGTRYYFQVRATGLDGDSDASNTATTQLAASPHEAVVIPDENLRRELALGSGQPITQLDVALHDYLTPEHRRISDLTGLEYAVNLSVLSLSDNQITDVSALGGLTALTSLSLSKNQVVDVSPLGNLTGLTVLGLSSNQIVDVSPLGNLTALTSLTLDSNQIVDVSALGSLTALTALRLSNNQVVDVSALGNLTALRELWLHNNAIAVGVSALGNIWWLDALYLDNNKITDVSGLGDVDLRALYLANNQITDVSALGSQRWLRKLDLTNNRIADVSAFGGLSALESLKMSYNRIADVSALGSLTSLRSLDADHNEISDVSELGRLRTLDRLNLSHNRISDVTALGGLHVRGLDLSHNQITDASALAHLAELGSLDLSGNALTEIALGNSMSPSRLFFAHNQIADLSPLAGITTLTKLHLSNNLISDVGPLRDLDQLAELDLSNNQITDVSALDDLPYLRELDLSGNALAAMPLLSLDSLHRLDLSNNQLTDVSALSGLSPQLLDLSDNHLAQVPTFDSDHYWWNLDISDNKIAGVAALDGLRASRVFLADNEITDVSAALAQVQELDLSNNVLTDVSSLRDLALHRLILSNNQITDISPLGDLHRGELDLSRNAIADVSPLAGFTYEGDVRVLRGNPLSADSIERHAPSLRAAGAAVLAGQPVPLFPAAADPSDREGFVRVLNRSAKAGEVLIEAVDDAGVRRGPVRLAVGAGGAAHFNSADLEGGNTAKGLRGGVGAPTDGSWRLELLSTLNIEVLAYIRTPDGFLTSIHDVLPREMLGIDEGYTGQNYDLQAAIFNPAKNAAQRSSLRLINAGPRMLRVPVRGEDDLGAERLADFEVRRGAVTLTAAALEGNPPNPLTPNDAPGRLGRGVGKWRLRVTAPSWVDAMSLLESPRGHLTNLSTVPAIPADGVWRVPLFPASSVAERQGFVRIANLGGAVEATVVAVDDGGVRSGPVALGLGALQTVHFNSADLELGNPAKGLGPGVGTPTQGDWRLEITSESHIRVTAFVRAAGGFLTSMHDVVPIDGDAHEVVFFNPGRNARQVSLLRLVNDGDLAATATVTGMDDAANPSGEASATIPAGHAMTFTAAQLEDGATGLSGSLGAGQGKWRLRVESDRPLTVMSLLASPSGHLTNLSTRGSRAEPRS